VLVELLARERPHLVGTQEGLYHQLRDVERGLERYRWIGLGRDGGSRGEFMAIFYDPARLEPLAFDHFWLSDTPETMGSNTWGAACRRMVTWVRFRDRAEDVEFFAINTHFDHVAADAREKSAALLVRRAAALDPELPVVLLGDFNCAAGASAPFRALVEAGPFEDAFAVARELGAVHATGNGWDPPRAGPRIDWILTRGAVTVERAEVVAFDPARPFPSDHFPVQAALRLGR
jgi:endonuclease/exonuclease/phosphatase family metal-dependent hydrolase